MPTVNEAILDGNIRHMVWLERYKSGTVRKIIAQLNRADEDLAAIIAVRIARIDERGYDLGPDTTKRLQATLDSIREQRAEAYKLLDDSLRSDLSDFAAHESDFQARVIENAVPVDLEMTRPSLSALRAVVLSQPFRGRILAEWTETLEDQDVKRISDALKIGLTEGQTTDQIVRRVIGTKAAQYRDGILEMSRAHATAVIRTAIAHVANAGGEALYEANSDIVKGVKWVSVLDGRTTLICQSRDGNIYPINSGPRPPAHWNCRSRTVPYLGETSVVGTRASQIGPVPGDVTYPGWLAAQSAKVQDQVLGPTRAKLFRNGETIDRFVDQTGHVYTLQELKRRDADIWNQTFAA